MLCQKLLDSCGSHKLVNKRLTVEQSGAHVFGECSAEPAVDYVHRESSLFSTKNCFRQEPLANLAMQPFARTVPDFEGSRQPLDVFDYFFVKIGYTDLERVRH